MVNHRPISALAPRAEPEQEGDAKPRAIFTFWLGSEEYGIELAAVKEIVKLKDYTVTRVPTAPSFVPGILSLRGDVIPLVDLKLRLGLGGGESGPATVAGARIVVCEHRGGSFGVVVDRVGGVVHIPESRLEKPPAHISSAEAEFIERLGKYAPQERRRAGEFLPGANGEEAVGETVETAGVRIVAILHVPKVVDFGLADEDEIDETNR